MPTQRSIADLLFLFRDGQAAKQIGPDDFEDLIFSLHPGTGSFVDLPTAPGGLAAWKCWQNNGIIQVTLTSGTGPRSFSVSSTVRAAASLRATPIAVQRATTLGTATTRGAGRFIAPNPTVTHPSTGVQPTFADEFNSHNANQFAYDSFDEGGDAFWSNDPSQTPRLFTFGNSICNMWVLNEPSGGKDLSSEMQDTYNPPNNFTQSYGYWEVAVAVDRVQGLIYQCLVLTAPQFDWWNFVVVEIWTDENNVQHVSQNTSNANISADYSSSNGWDATQMHLYGMDWTTSRVDFYRDRQLIGGGGNPGGGYNNGWPFYMKMHTNVAFAAALDIHLPDPGVLPKGAHVDSFYVYPRRPF